MAPSPRPGLLCALLLALAGCAADPASAPPTGVDGLEIPTPSPDAADFVDVVDNPWLPLTPGSEWVYESTGGGTVTVTVTGDTRAVAGITTTVVREVVREAGGTAERTFDWFAQDSDGNVWHFGGDGSWEAGQDGARAALAMPASPRVGDGYRTAYLPGEAEDRAEVLSLDGEAQVPLGSYDGLLVTEVSSPLEPGLTGHHFYARGVGPVLEETVSGGSERVELVSFDRG